VADDANGIRPGFDASMAGRRAECDGGGMIEGTRYAGRQEFTGTLTGDYYDQGDPPWRWYLMKDLTIQPEGFASDAVWCESESLFLIDDHERAEADRPASASTRIEPDAGPKAE